VAIKVDREERPDVDAVYMTATQAMTGQGGWPMTVFATPDGEPFFCGTYYPRDGFMRLVAAVADTWHNQRDAVLRQGAAVVQAIGEAQGRGGFERVTGSVTAELLDAAVEQLGKSFDAVHAGFGDAPKFPPSMVMLFLLRHYQRTGDADALEQARATAEAMARGGIYDQLAGGFARYSVDERWWVPHFEKMLYDNALLLRAYSLLWRLTGDPLARRVATDTAQFLVDDLQEPGGGFASSLDADTDGVEGATYAWTPDQLRSALGDTDGDWAADLFGVTPAGTFEHGTSVLRLLRDVDDRGSEEIRQRWADVRARLLAVRRERPQPGRDSKVVAGWNGLAVTGLVEFVSCVEAFGGGESDAAAAAARAAGEHLADVLMVDGRLRRASRDGIAGSPAGVLDDYGCVAEAFGALHQLTGEPVWLERARVLVDAALEHFDDGDGGFHDTPDDGEQLIARPADPTDNASPSGLSSMTAALTTVAALTGEVRYRERAEQALEAIAPVIARHPRFAGYAAATAEALLSGPYEIAIAVPPTQPITDLLAAARQYAPPGAVIVVGPPDAPGVPLLADRPLRDGNATAYVCRGFVCDRPVTTAADLQALLP